MTCNDCIKEDVCYKKPVHKLDIELNELGGCSSFKNKADFVEVVRCKDCAYRYTKYCNAKHERADMDYCSSGERK